MILYPERFNNKTNGITFRQLAHGLQPGAFRPHHLSHRRRLEKGCHGVEELGQFVSDPSVLTKLLDVKAEKKAQLVLSEEHPRTGTEPGFHFRHSGKASA